MASSQVLPTPLDGGGGGGAGAPTFNGFFGDGADGDFTVVAASLLVPGRERQYNNLTVQATGAVEPRGFKLCVAGTLTNAGHIRDDGNPATGGATGGGGLIAAQFLRGTSGGGVNGRSTTGAGSNGIASSGTSYNNIGTLPNGGNGGNAGAQVGGTGGVASAANSRWASSLFVGRAGTAAFNGGGGGASGAAELNTGSATSGGGGGGGGILWLSAKTINNAGGIISARGGDGGAGSSVGTGVAGGGGGGGGGCVGIITTTPVASIGGTVSAAGGLGGAGSNGGAAGQQGVTGSLNYYIMA